MAASSEKESMPVTLYQVDTSLFLDDDFNYITRQIINRVGLSGFNFQPDKLARRAIDDFSFKVYYQVKTKPPQWRGFLKGILADDALLATARNRTHSFLLFIRYKEYVFAVCGGAGAAAIRQFVVHDFGMQLLVRLFEKHDRVVKATQERGVSGIVLGQQRYYRGDQRFSDENEFGKVYKKFQAQVKKRQLTEIFGFHPDEVKAKGSACTAKDSFQLGKSVASEVLLDNIKTYVDLISTKEGNFTLNKVIPVNKKTPTGQKLIQELRDELVKKLYSDCINNTSSDLDFCHPDFEAYRNAERFTIMLDRETIIEMEDEELSLDIVIQEVKDLGHLVIDDPTTFRISVLENEIKSFDGEGGLLTTGTVLQHLHGEITYLGNTYFLIDGQWYRIDPEFIKDLNEGCLDVLQQAWQESLFDASFNLNKDESVFNQQFIGRPGLYVFDTITPDNIEACDILKSDDHNTWFIHVKKGFDNSIRDLASQIMIAAKTIQADKKSGYHYLDKLQSQTEDGIFSDSPAKRSLAKQTFPSGGIKTLLNNRKDIQIVFCLAFVDKADGPRSLKDNIDDFRSNIAKYSLIELYKQIRGMGFDLKIVQLPALPREKKSKM
jgi:uncharacterized protein (TIGR04141 family)